MAVAHGSDPVRWWVFEDWCRPLARAGEAVPPASAPVWEARYDNELERGKRTSRTPGLVPHFDAVLGRLRGWAAEWAGRLGYPVEDDHTLHGGGLHVTAPGGRLATHLDYDRHPLVPNRRRALNLIAFLHPEWRSEWGGALVLTDPLGEVVCRFEPRPGRLVAFEVGDLSYHGVEPVAADCPAERVSAAVYYLAAATGRSSRLRALFLPPRGTP